MADFKQIEIKVRHQAPSSRRAPGSNSRSSKSRVTPGYFSVEDTARYFQVSSRTVWRWVDRGELACHRFGRRVLVSAEDMATFAAINRHAVTPSIQVI
jgi:excisionase family DNA binding protein